MKTITPEILAILSALDIAGNEVRITTQLDRKTYLEVDKVLEACGGAWDRKTKAHIFPADALTRLDPVLTTGQVLLPKNELAFFPTPPALAQQLVGWLKLRPGMMTLEPSAGTGHIVDALLAAQVGVIFCERDPAMREALYARLGALPVQAAPFGAGMAPNDDFLDYDPRNNVGWGGFDAVAMNPPFQRCGKGDHLDHVRHAYALLKPGGRLGAILPRSVEFRQDARYRAFRTWFEALDSELTRLPEGSFKEAGTSVSTNVLLLDKPEAA